MSKVIVIALDAATWDCIIPWARSGKLPFFQSLLTSKQTYHCKSTMPPYTPVAWTTAFTNLSPAEHGISDFRTIVEGNIRITDTTHTYKNTLWYRASKAGKKVVVFNVPMTYPTQPVNGSMISSFTATDTDKDFFYPNSLRSSFLKKFPSYHITAPGEYIKGDNNNNILYAKSLLQALDQKIAAANWLLEKQSWELAILGILEIDHLQHFFWDQKDSNRSPIKRGYQRIDRWLSWLSTSQKATILIVSDHGAGSATGTIFPNILLENIGLLHYKKHPITLLKKLLRGNLLRPKRLEKISRNIKLKNALSKANNNNQNILVRKIFLDYDDIDFTKTKAFSFGEYGGIYCMDKSKKTIREITNALKKALIGHQASVQTSSEYYGTSQLHPHIPDIQFLIDDGGMTSSSVYAWASAKLFDPLFQAKSGNHRTNGILALTTGPHTMLGDATLYDVVPTVESLLDLPKQSQRGQSLPQSQITSKVII